MNALYYLIFILLASVGLSKSAVFVVDSVNKLSKKLRVSDFTLGFFILGLATSTPEIFVGLNSLIDGVPELSVGNLIGGIIVLLTLVVGIAALITGKVNLNHGFTPKELLITSFLLITPIFVLSDGVISRADGLLLVTLYIGLFFLLNRSETIFEKIHDEISEHSHHLGNIVTKLIIGVAGLLLFSKIAVDVGILLSLALNVPPLVIGLVVLSFGTNLPELTIGIISRKKHLDLALGNFLGSAAANIPLMGILAIKEPIYLAGGAKTGGSLVLLVLSVSLFTIFVKTNKVISRFEGAILLCAYVLFLLFEILVINP